MKIHKTKSIILKILSLLIFIVLILSMVHVYNLFNSAPWNSPKEYTLIVKKDSTYTTIAKELVGNNIVQNEMIFLRQANNFSFPSLGDYKLRLPANNMEILEQIKIQSEKYLKIPKGEFKKLLIKEGDDMDKIIFNMTRLGMGDQTKIEGYFKDINNFTKYSYLPKPLDCKYGDVKTCAKFLVEGYISPATYDLDINQSLAYNIDTILTISQKKFGVGTTTKLSSIPTFENITMASLIEKESGYGKRDPTTEQSKKELNIERRNMVAVFANRNREGMKWQSNPTTTYGTIYKLCETTIEITNCKKLDDPNILNNRYNTYTNAKLFAPISNPSREAIEAVQDPIANDYLFFIADKKGLTRFAKTYQEFLKIEQEIIRSE